jgi:hypothetical protein
MAPRTVLRAKPSQSTKTVDGNIRPPDWRAIAPPLSRMAYSLSLTQALALAIAASSLDGSVPPAMAISGLPPPLPPT